MKFFFKTLVLVLLFCAKISSVNSQGILIFEISDANIGDKLLSKNFINISITFKYKNNRKQNINRFLLIKGYSDNNIYYLYYCNKPR